MIIGIGSDLTDIRRIEKVMDRFATRFTQRCFTNEERRKAENRRGTGHHIQTYATRFAAKEACAKALGSGFNDGVYMRDIGVVSDTQGRPAIELTGGALKKLEDRVPQGQKPFIHVTISDEPPLAQATVIIESR